MQDGLEPLGAFQGGEDLVVEVAAAVQLVGLMHLQLDPQRLHGIQEGPQEVFGVTGVIVARARDVAQRLAHVRLVAPRVEKVINPPQRVHGVGHVIQLAVRSLLPQGAAHAFRGQNFPQVPDVIFSRRRNARAQQVPGLVRQQLAGYLIGPVP